MPISCIDTARKWFIRIPLLATGSTVCIAAVWRWGESRVLCCMEHCQAFLQPSDWRPPWQIHQVGSGLGWRWVWGLMALVLATFLIFVANYSTGGNLGEAGLWHISQFEGAVSRSGEGHGGRLAVDTVMRAPGCQFTPLRTRTQRGKAGTHLPSFSAFSSVWALSLWDGVLLIQKGASLLS